MLRFSTTWPFSAHVSNVQIHVAAHRPEQTPVSSDVDSLAYWVHPEQLQRTINDIPHHPHHFLFQCLEIVIHNGVATLVVDLPAEIMCCRQSSGSFSGLGGLHSCGDASVPRPRVILTAHTETPCVLSLSSTVCDVPIWEWADTGPETDNPGRGTCRCDTWHTVTIDGFDRPVPTKPPSTSPSPPASGTTTKSRLSYTLSVSVQSTAASATRVPCPRKSFGLGTDLHSSSVETFRGSAHGSAQSSSRGPSIHSPFIPDPIPDTASGAMSLAMSRSQRTPQDHPLRYSATTATVSEGFPGQSSAATPAIEDVQLSSLEIGMVDSGGSGRPVVQIHYTEGPARDTSQPPWSLAAGSVSLLRPIFKSVSALMKAHSAARTTKESNKYKSKKYSWNKAQPPARASASVQAALAPAPRPDFGQDPDGSPNANTPPPRPRSEVSPSPAIRIASASESTPDPTDAVRMLLAAASSSLALAEAEHDARPSMRDASTQTPVEMAETRIRAVILKQSQVRLKLIFRSWTGRFSGSGVDKGKGVGRDDADHQDSVGVMARPREVL